MGSALSTAPEVKRKECREEAFPCLDEIPLWELESTPRLDVADLPDPTLFHARLVAWLMNQK